MCGDGERVTCAKTRAWIKSLAVPPQWTDVTIDASPKARILATGRDADGRKQYIYSPAFRAAQDAEKYAHLADFGQQLGHIRAQYRMDIRAKNSRFKPALALALIDEAAMRVGSYAYTKRNDTYGAITLRRKHIRFRPGQARIAYRAKGGKRRHVDIDTPDVIIGLRRLARKCAPSQPIFSAAGKRTTAQNVRDYLKTLDEASSPKDLRTWHGSVAAFAHLRALGPGDKATLKDALKCAASRLGNTPAICRTSYIHPHIITAIKMGRPDHPTTFPGPSKAHLSKAESDFLNWLELKCDPA